MPQTFTLGPTTAKQDTILAYIATKRGVTVQELIDGEISRIFGRAKNEYDQDEGQKVTEAYLAASNAVQNGIKNALGLV